MRIWKLTIKNNDLNDSVNEIWLPISGFDGYLISNLGRVFSRKTNRVLQPLNNGDGYLQVNLYKSDGVYRKYIHRLVLEAFCPIADNTLEANHINGSKEDNRLANLSWVTSSENKRHSVYQLGNYHGGKRKPVSQLTRDGRLVAEYKSAWEASRETGVDRRNICRCAIGSRNHAGGYKWSFLKEDTNPSKAA